MTSTPSTILRLELMGSGDQPGTWGNTTNSNIGSLLEGAIAGVANVSVSSAAQAFIALDYAPDEARMAIIKLSTTGAVTTAFAVYAPPVSKIYVVQNNSAYAATVYNSTVLGNTVAAGAGVVVGGGESAVVFSDGANFYGLSLATGVVPVIRGGTGANNAVDARTNLGLTIGADVAANNSPAFTGTPTAPTALVGTNNTQLATTAFVNGELANYGPSKLNTTTGTAPVYGVRAWVNYNGVLNAIVEAGNISSVFVAGPGDYTFYFTTPLPSDTYAVVGTANNYNYGQPLIVSVKYETGSLYGYTVPSQKSIYSVRVVVGTGDNTSYIAPPNLNVMIIC